MTVEILGVMIPIIAIIGAIIAIIYLRKYQNNERMAMIDKGLDPAFFAKQPRSTSGALRASLLLIGAGLGLLMGHVLDRNLNMSEEVAYFSMLLIFGGTGLGLAYLIEEKKIRKQA